MSTPYRAEPTLPASEPRRSLDPWLLSLLFAWVCDVGRIGVGFVNRRPVSGELGFGVVLLLISLVVGGVSLNRRMRSA
ncbi:MAG TPA: hypothetical protein VGI39_12105 [Polyangiaceae bacterium]|jgi:hypothetical protein